MRHIGQNSTRIEQVLQLNMWPHGMNTVSLVAIMQILHICCSRTCSSTCLRTCAADSQTVRQSHAHHSRMDNIQCHHTQQRGKEIVSESAFHALRACENR